MQREIPKLLDDMFEAATAIQQFVATRTPDDLGTDSQLRSAVYFQFMIIGEALTQIRISDESIYDQFTENFRITGFRNQIVHGYFKLDPVITWRIIVEKLPVLIAEIEALRP